MRAHEFLEAHQHQEIIRMPIGDAMVYINDHAVATGYARGVGPKMLSNLATFAAKLPEVAQRIPIDGRFWIQDRRTKSAAYFRRIEVPGEERAYRLETCFQGDVRAGNRTPVFVVNAYSGPETAEAQKKMRHARYISRFVGRDVMASNISRNIQTSGSSDQELITRPDTQDSQRYDRAFRQAKKKT